MSDVDFVPVMPLADVRKGSMQAVVIGLREIIVCHTRAGSVVALDNICTHAFSRMSEGRLRGDRLICPLHGASFDVLTGVVLKGPATVPLATHTTRIVDGIIEVRLRARPDSAQ